VRAGTIEPVEAPANRFDFSRVECTVGRELGTWIGTVGRVEPDAIRGKVVGPAQLGEELGTGGEPGATRIAGSDPRGVDDVDRIDDDAARGRPVGAAGHDLRSLPASERQRHGAVRDRVAKAHLHQHGRHLAARRRLRQLTLRRCGPDERQFDASWMTRQTRSEVQGMSMCVTPR